VPRADSRCQARRCAATAPLRRASDAPLQARRQRRVCSVMRGASAAVVRRCVRCATPAMRVRAGRLSRTPRHRYARRGGTAWRATRRVRAARQGGTARRAA
jgi:hypothetical protein